MYTIKKTVYSDVFIISREPTCFMLPNQQNDIYTKSSNDMVIFNFWTC